MVSRRQVASNTSRSFHLSSPLCAHLWIIDRVCPRTFGFGFKPRMLVCKWNGGNFLIIRHISLFVLISSLLGRYCAQSICCLSCWPDAFQKCWGDSCEQVGKLKFLRWYIANISISAFRSFLISIVTSGTFPMIEAYGVAVTNTASALLAWLGFG